MFYNFFLSLQWIIEFFFRYNYSRFLFFSLSFLNVFKKRVLYDSWACYYIACLLISTDIYMYKFWIKRDEHSMIHTFIHTTVILRLRGNYVANIAVTSSIAVLLHMYPWSWQDVGVIKRDSRYKIVSIGSNQDWVSEYNGSVLLLVDDKRPNSLSNKEEETKKSDEN